MDTKLTSYVWFLHLFCLSWGLPEDSIFSSCSKPVLLIQPNMSDQNSRTERSTGKAQPARPVRRMSCSSSALRRPSMMNKWQPNSLKSSSLGTRTSWMDWPHYEPRSSPCVPSWQTETLPSLSCGRRYENWGGITMIWNSTCGGTTSVSRASRSLSSKMTR